MGHLGGHLSQKGQALHAALFQVGLFQLADIVAQILDHLVKSQIELSDFVAAGQLIHPALQALLGDVQEVFLQSQTAVLRGTVTGHGQKDLMLRDTILAGDLHIQVAVLDLLHVLLQAAEPLSEESGQKRGGDHADYKKDPGNQSQSPVQPPQIPGQHECLLIPVNAQYSMAQDHILNGYRPEIQADTAIRPVQSLFELFAVRTGHRDPFSEKPLISMGQDFA